MAEENGTHDWPWLARFIKWAVTKVGLPAVAACAAGLLLWFDFFVPIKNKHLETLDKVQQTDSEIVAELRNLTGVQMEIRQTISQLSSHQKETTAAVQHTTNAIEKLANKN